MSGGKKYWRHAKYRGQRFAGTYKYADGEREFWLIAIEGRGKRISLESPATAKKLGWVRR